MIKNAIFILLSLLLASCNLSQLNNPYPKNEAQQNVLYSAFSEQPKHLDPAIAYGSDEYKFIAQIYEPPFQYHYLKRPYQLVPLTAKKMPTINYLNAQGQILPQGADDKQIAFTDYLIEIQAGIKYQPHPAFAKNANGQFLYHQLNEAALDDIHTLMDFPQAGTRELIAQDYVYQIKRLADPQNQSPIAEIMKQYIVGFAEFAQQRTVQRNVPLTEVAMSGVTALNRYQYRIRIKGKYPQFKYWLAMLFFAPMPWEADVFYAQPDLKAKNITLDWFPVGTGAYLLTENNPNRRMVLSKNPYFHLETYPSEGEPEDKQRGLLQDAGKKLPFIEQKIYSLEKETIPRWNKFLQGYYDDSGAEISSDSFDQAIQISGTGNALLTPAMIEKGIKLETAINTTSYYLGFNMLDAVVGGKSESARKLRLAISIAVDYEEYISIFLNGRAIAAQGVLPPGIYGADPDNINHFVYDLAKQRQSIKVARQLLAEAGYVNGINPKTKEALTLYFDTNSISVDDRSRMSWYRKQFEKLGINLVVRATDYNRFQEKVRNGNAQLFFWGWNADYPDPENFFFLLYSKNAKVKYGGENAVNYQNAEFDRLFEQMRNMDDSPLRYQIIQQMQELVRHDAPWLFAYHPKNFVLSHSWYQNQKPNLMANNQLKYLRIDPIARLHKREIWNKAVFWPLWGGIFLLIILLIPVWQTYRRRTQMTLK